MAIFSKVDKKGTFGDIDGDILIEIAIFIEERYLVGLDEILDITGEERLVFL